MEHRSKTWWFYPISSPVYIFNRAPPLQSQHGVCRGQKPTYLEPWWMGCLILEGLQYVEAAFPDISFHQGGIHLWIWGDGNNKQSLEPLSSLEGCTSSFVGCFTSRHPSLYTLNYTPHPFILVQAEAAICWCWASNVLVHNPLISTEIRRMRVYINCIYIIRYNMLY